MGVLIGLFPRLAMAYRLGGPLFFRAGKINESGREPGEGWGVIWVFAKANLPGVIPPPPLPR